jgi:hypothetical protein
MLIGILVLLAAGIILFTMGFSLLGLWILLLSLIGFVNYIWSDLTSQLHEIRRPVSEWKTILYPHAWIGTIEEMGKLADVLGYKKIAWNGAIYTSNKDGKWELTSKTIYNIY